MRPLPLNQLLLCNCTPPSAIATLPANDCIERIGQVIGFGIQRQKTAGVLNTFTVANAALLATWTAALALTTSAKVQFSPQLGGPVHEPGAERTYGGNNDVPGGGTIILGESNSKFTGSFLDVKQALIAVLKTYRCERDLQVYLISEHLNIWGIVDDPDGPTNWGGIPIENFWITSKMLGMRDTPDKNNVTWDFPPEWSDNLWAITPSDFNPKVDLLL